LKAIDFNSDVGEGFGVYKMGDDRAILGCVSSANIACGMHAGDPQSMTETVRLAVMQGVAIGAHRGFMDLQGFGRRSMQLSSAEVYHLVLYQVGALQAIAKAAGSKLSHVKAHGALYNMAALDMTLAQAIGRPVSAVDERLVFFGLAGSALIRAGEEIGLQVAQEVFADRTYQDDGSLTPRSRANAMVTCVDQSIAQVLRMVREGAVRSVNGVDIAVRADTLCIHGDQPGAPEFAFRIKAALEAEGFLIQAPSKRW